MPLALDAVQRIVAIDDTAVRNLWITQSYADLAERLLAIYRTDQSWCSFAIWASNTAGVSIRGHELPSFVDRLLSDRQDHAGATLRAANHHHRLLRRVVGRLEPEHLERLVRHALRQVSDHIAHGNTLVFAELAPIFVRFVEALETRRVVTERDVPVLVRDIGAAEGDALVRQAFRHYALAAATDDDRRRAEHVLTANIAAVLHEQQRLQGDIAAALDAGLIDVGESLDALAHHLLPARVRGWIVEAAHRRVAPHVEHLWDHISTETLMTLDVPGARLHLGRDVPMLTRDRMFPSALEHPESSALVELLTEWDPTGGTGVGSGAGDWCVLRERMGYIVNLFRSRQRDHSLTTLPFSEDELVEMGELRVPESIDA